MLILLPPLMVSSQHSSGRDLLKYKAGPIAVTLKAFQWLSVVFRCEGDKALTVHSLQALWDLALHLLPALMSSLTLPQPRQPPWRLEHAKHALTLRLCMAVPPPPYSSPRWTWLPPHSLQSQISPLSLKSALTTHRNLQLVFPAPLILFYHFLIVVIPF